MSISPALGAASPLWHTVMMMMVVVMRMAAAATECESHTHSSLWGWMQRRIQCVESFNDAGVWLPVHFILSRTDAQRSLSWW